MGERELGLVAAILGMMSLTVVGANLVSAIWAGRRPRGAPFAGSLAVLAGATAVVSFSARPEQPILVAAASESPAPCAADVRVVHGAAGSERWRLTGSVSSPPCAIWAVIEDPRTAVLWVQGPALQSQEQWSLEVLVGTGHAPDGILPYRISVMTIPEGDRTPLMSGDRQLITLRDVPGEARWILRDVPVTAGELAERPSSTGVGEVR